MGEIKTYGKRTRITLPKLNRKGYILMGSTKKYRKQNNNLEVNKK